jgi:hypothetical protein
MRCPPDPPILGMGGPLTNMRFLVVHQTSARRFIAHILGTQIWAKGTTEEFAVGTLMKKHGFRFGINVMPESEIRVRAHWAGYCAVPIEETK